MYCDIQMCQFLNTVKKILLINRIQRYLIIQTATLNQQTKLISGTNIKITSNNETDIGKVK